MKHILDGTTFRDLLNIRDLISDPDRGEQCRDAEGSDEGGARDLQAAHPQPQESDIDFLIPESFLQTKYKHTCLPLLARGIVSHSKKSLLQILAKGFYNIYR